MGLNFDLLQQLTFYGAYHRHPINKLIHFIFVPCIMWSALVWLAYLGELAPMPAAVQQVLGGGALINVPLIVYIIYALFYTVLDPVAGSTWAVFIGLPIWLTSTLFATAFAENGAYIALGVQVISWYMQIHPGHAIFERRKPALMDSLVQAFALAPLFVWFEALFLIGFRPKLHQELREAVDREIERAAKEK